MSAGAGACGNLCNCSCQTYPTHPEARKRNEKTAHWEANTPSERMSPRGPGGLGQVILPPCLF